MTAEREFAGFVLPFTTGIFLATGPALIRMTYFPVLCTASLTATAVLLMFMMHPCRREFSVWVPWIMLAGLGLAAGTFSGLTSLIMDLGSCESSLSVRAAGFGRRLGEHIDSVPFGNSDTNSLLKALLTGERNDIPRSVTEAFRDSGAAHILSLSGFHLGIVYAIARWSLSGLGNTAWAARLRSALIVVFCGFYTLATGAGPSIVRAFLFIFLGEVSRLTHRSRSTGTLLLSALLIQLIMDPSSIRSFSFQLSYAAMACIAWIYPRLRDFWPDSPHNDSSSRQHPTVGICDSWALRRVWSTGSAVIAGSLRWIWNSATMSIACQLPTAPLAFFYFGTFPRYFLLTNLLALPLTGLLIPVGLITIILSGLGLCPAFLLTATDLLASTLTSCLEIIAGM